MNIKIGSYRMKISILIISASYFAVLFNPLGWHMFLHVAPFYLVFILMMNKENFDVKYNKEIFFMFLFVLYTLISLVFVNGKGTTGKVIRYIYEFLVLMFLLISKLALRMWHF